MYHLQLVSICPESRIKYFQKLEIEEKNAMVSPVQGPGIMKSWWVVVFNQHRQEVEKPQIKQIYHYGINGLLKPLLHSEAFR